MTICAFAMNRCLLCAVAQNHKLVQFCRQTLNAAEQNMKASVLWSRHPVYLTTINYPLQASWNRIGKSIDIAYVGPPLHKVMDLGTAIGCISFQVFAPATNASENPPTAVLFDETEEVLQLFCLGRQWSWGKPRNRTCV